MTTEQNQLEQNHLFSAPIYIINKPEFLLPLLKISKKFLNNKKKETELNCNYPVYMTDSFIGEPDIQDFSNFVAQCAWSILDGQGMR